MFFYGSSYCLKLSFRILPISSFRSLNYRLELLLVSSRSRQYIWVPNIVSCLCRFLLPGLTAKAPLFYFSNSLFCEIDPIIRIRVTAKSPIAHRSIITSLASEPLQGSALLRMICLSAWNRYIPITYLQLILTFWPDPSSSLLAFPSILLILRKFDFQIHLRYLSFHGKLWTLSSWPTLLFQ